MLGLEGGIRDSECKTRGREEALGGEDTYDDLFEVARCEAYQSHEAAMFDYEVGSCRFRPRSPDP